MLLGLSDTIQYEVVSGDTLSNIADQYGTTWQQIASDNSIDDPNVIQVGDVLTINTSGESVPAVAAPIKVPTVSQAKTPAKAAATSTSNWLIYGGVAILTGAVFMIVKNKNKASIVVQKVKKQFKKISSKG